MEDNRLFFLTFHRSFSHTRQFTAADTDTDTDTDTTATDTTSASHDRRCERLINCHRSSLPPLIRVLEGQREEEK